MKQFKLLFALEIIRKICFFLQTDSEPLSRLFSKTDFVIL